jgi:hypothetical protein
MRNCPPAPDESAESDEQEESDPLLDSPLGAVCLAI